MWFLRPFRADGWLLLDAECTSTAGTRGTNRANIYSADGLLAARVNQEGLIQRHDGCDRGYPWTARTAVSSASSIISSTPC
jgi:acyl-CoA thioesterase-2